MWRDVEGAQTPRVMPPKRVRRVLNLAPNVFWRDGGIATFQRCLLHALGGLEQPRIELTSFHLMDRPSDIPERKRQFGVPKERRRSRFCG